MQTFELIDIISNKEFFYSRRVNKQTSIQGSKRKERKVFKLGLSQKYFFISFCHVEHSETSLFSEIRFFVALRMTKRATL